LESTPNSSLADDGISRCTVIAVSVMALPYPLVGAPTSGPGVEPPQRM
jgi:hypothetical protein